MTQSVQDLLAAHPVDDPIWDRTNLCDILIDTVNRANAMAESHIVEPEYIFCRPNPAFKDIKLIVDVASDTIEEKGSTNLSTIMTSGTIHQTQLLLVMIWEVPIHSQQSLQVDL